jgi:hypothetical protein
VSGLRLTGEGAARRRRVIGAWLTAAVVMALGTGWMAAETTDRMESEVRVGRLALAQLAAGQADRLIAEAFFELEIAAIEGDEPTGPLPGTVFHREVQVVDQQGNPLDGAVPPSPPELARAIEQASAADDRLVSMPWLDPANGHTMVALGLPVYDADGTRSRTVVGVMDLAEPLLADLFVPAARLGPDGHADVLDERGIVLASTDPEHVLTPGHHADFYAEVATARVPIVGPAAHLHPEEDEYHEPHVMAYAPLQNAPWGVALGSAQSATLSGVSDVRKRFVVFGVAGLITLLLAGAFSVQAMDARAWGPSGHDC